MSPNNTPTAALYGNKFQHTLTFMPEEDLIQEIEKSISVYGKSSQELPDYIVRLCYPNPKCSELLDEAIHKFEQYGYGIKVHIDDGILWELRK